MKTYRIELERLKQATHGNGLVELAIDAQIVPRNDARDGTSTSVLSMDESNARVLLSLLKSQLAELDRRKARSQR